MQVNGKRLKAFMIERSVQQGCPLSPLLYVLTLEPLLRRLRDESARLVLRGVSLTGSIRVKISAYADDITVYVSSRQDILAVKRYEKVAGAKVNFDKSEGLWLGAWRGRPAARALLLEWRIPPHPRGVVQTRPHLERNWLKVRAKVEVQVGAWFWSGCP